MLKRYLLTIILSLTFSAIASERCDSLKEELTDLLFKEEALKHIDGRPLSSLKNEHDKKMAELVMLESLQKVKNDYINGLEKFKRRIEYVNESALKELIKIFEPTEETLNNSVIPYEQVKHLVDQIHQRKDNSCTSPEISCNQNGSTCHKIVSDFLEHYNRLCTISRGQLENARNEWARQISDGLPEDHLQTSALVKESHEKIARELESLARCKSDSNTNCYNITWKGVRERLFSFFKSLRNRISKPEFLPNQITKIKEAREDEQQYLQNNLSYLQKRNSGRLSNYDNLFNKHCKESKDKESDLCKSISAAKAEATQSAQKILEATSIDSKKEPQARLRDLFAKAPSVKDFCAYKKESEKEFLTCLYKIDDSDLKNKIEKYKEELRDIISKMSSIAGSDEAMSLDRIKRHTISAMKSSRCGLVEVELAGCRSLGLFADLPHDDRPVKVLMDSSANIIADLTGFSEEKEEREIAKDCSLPEMEKLAPTLCKGVLEREERRQLHEKYYVTKGPRGKKKLEKRPTTGEMFGEALGQSFAQYGPSMFLGYQYNKMQTNMLYNQALFSKQSYYNYNQWVQSSQPSTGICAPGVYFGCGFYFNQPGFTPAPTAP